MDWHNQKLESIDLTLQLTINRALHEEKGIHLLSVDAREQPGEFNILMTTLAQKLHAQEEALARTKDKPEYKEEAQYNEQAIKSLKALICKFNVCVKA